MNVYGWVSYFIYWLKLKSTMLQDRLNELTILSIESEVLELLDYKTLINDFATKKARRLL